ncbi:hypothetical protein GCM10010441_41840 [Kitasatospora paracochleata]
MARITGAISAIRPTISSRDGAVAVVLAVAAMAVAVAVVMVSSSVRRRTVPGYAPGPGPLSRSRPRTRDGVVGIRQVGRDQPSFFRPAPVST